MILNLIEVETSLINTNHPDFIGSADSLLNLFQDDQNVHEGEGDDEEEQDEKKFTLLKKPNLGQDQPNLNENKHPEITPAAETAEQDKKVEEKSGSWMPSLFGGGKNKKTEPIQGD